MRANPTVNRYLSDKPMDRIDHALGRPIWPLRESYRNYFATDIRSDLAALFDVSPHWELRNVTPDAMAFYSVTNAGRKALVDYLDGMGAGARWRAYAVRFDGHTRIVPARSRSGARYIQWLSISDCFCDLTFADFIKHSHVSLA